MILSDDLSLALRLGSAAAEVALPFFRTNVPTQHKADGSPVTDTDLAVEKRLLEILAVERPTDAILSEECGAIGNTDRRWVLDPIDGTAEFIADQDGWGTHIALEQDGEIVLGVITRPVTNQCWWAERGQGAHSGVMGSIETSTPLHVSTTADMASARATAWADEETSLTRALQQRTCRIEASYDDALDLVAGRLDLLLDCHGQPWDLAPVVVIVEEAGGSFMDLEGGHRLDRTGCWLTNGVLDGAVRELARQAGDGCYRSR